MAIGTQQDSEEMMSEINMIPFIDVMLVLLIIFIITVPVIKHAVNIELPQASMEKVLDKPENIRLSVDADGVYFWNDQRVDDADIANRLTAAAAQQPEIDCDNAMAQFELNACAYKEFERADALVVGDPTYDRTQMGPVIAASAQSSIVSWRVSGRSAMTWSVRSSSLPNSATRTSAKPRACASGGM